MLHCFRGAENSPGKIHNWYSEGVKEGPMTRGIASLTLLTATALTIWAPMGCRKQEQAVVGVAQNAVQAEKKAQAAAQAAASERDRLHAQLDRIPLPTKSLYVNVKDANAWANPYLTVKADKLVLRVTTSSGKIDGKGKAKPESRSETEIMPADLPNALLGLPEAAWRYGRVVAVAEDPQAAKEDRPVLRRNVEAILKKLNDLGVVTVEWPQR